MELHQQGKLAEADRIYSEVLAAAPDHFDALHLSGVVAAQRGQRAEAERLIGRALATQPDHADARMNLANVLIDMLRFDDALANADRALAARPDNPEALNTRGVALLGLNRSDEALESLDRALTLRPDHADALSNRGVALAGMGRFADALDSYDRALAIRPIAPSTLNSRGIALAALRRLDEALASLDRSLELAPDNPEALNNRGSVLMSLDRPRDALADYERALALNSGFVDALRNRGLGLKSLRRFEESLACFDKLLAAHPNDPGAHANRASVLMDLERIEDALASCERAIELRPDFPEALTTRSNALIELDRAEEALASVDRALAIDPGYADALNSRGIVLQLLGRLDEALGYYARAQAVAPESAEPHMNEALWRLLFGDYPAGWAKYEWRWRMQSIVHLKREYTQPLWLGQEDLAGKTILVHAEQGYGDTIQFLRYIPLLAQRGARVLLAVQSPLKSLVTGLTGVWQVLGEGDGIPPFDFHCPLLSLALAFKTTVQTIPPLPRLAPMPAFVQSWRARLETTRKPRIGLAWSGRPVPRNRSIPAHRLVPLLGVEATIVSLQKEVREPDRQWLAAHPEVLHFGDELRDFSHTAALISAVDLVLSVDTAAAHLAGALRKPVWILLSTNTDWRWQLQGPSNPWYPTARLFRQSRLGDWDSVLGPVVSELRTYLAGI